MLRCFPEPNFGRPHITKQVSENSLARNSRIRMKDAQPTDERPIQAHKRAKQPLPRQRLNGFSQFHSPLDRVEHRCQHLFRLQEFTWAVFVIVRYGTDAFNAGQNVVNMFWQCFRIIPVDMNEIFMTEQGLWARFFENGKFGIAWCGSFATKENIQTIKTHD